MLWSFTATLAYSQNNEQQCGPVAGKVARAMFTTNIVNREPTDRVLILANDQDRLYFFTDLRQFQGQTISHRWEYDGRVIMQKKFEVKGPRWRVYSVHTLENNKTGRWTAVIADKNNCPIKAVVFEYVDKTAMGSNGSAIINLNNQ